MQNLKQKSFLKKYWLDFLLAAALFILLFSTGSKSWLLNKLLYTGLFNARTDIPSAIKAPEIQFQDSRGRIISTRQLLGKAVFLNFWATWCPPCLAEMPGINELHNDLRQDTNIVFLMVDVDGDLKKSSAFMTGHGYELPVYSSLGAMPAEIMSGTTPTTVIISPDGRIVHRKEGMSRYNTTAFESWIRGLH
jgi:thiol-disulfide isomerase/thioredoxin